MIDGIEIFEHYVRQLQREIYDNIWIGDARELIPNLNTDYDMIVASDVLEHMDEQKGTDLLTSIKNKSKNAFIVTPANCLPQGAVYNNEYETHVKGWTEEDLKKWGTVTRAGGANILEINNNT